MSSRNSRILCVGAAHWDVIAKGDLPVRLGDDVPGRVVWRPGGVAMNVARGLAELQCEVALCSIVGADEAGALLLQHAERSGVDCRPVARIEGAITGSYLAIEDSAGELAAAVADTALLEACAEQVKEQAAGAVSSASVLFLDANLPHTSLAWLTELASAEGIELAMNPVSPAKAERCVGLLDGPAQVTVIANLAEANVLTGTVHTTATSAAADLRIQGARTALVTDGGRRAALADPAGDFVSDPERAMPGASVTGAGDALTAAYLSWPRRREDPGGALDFALTRAVKHMEEATRR
ncbi:MAG: PfkB family carbohydrate kinase [Pseudomonadota bacterium]